VLRLIVRQLEMPQYYALHRKITIIQGGHSRYPNVHQEYL